MGYIVDRRNIDFLLFEMLGMEAILAEDTFAHCDRAAVGQVLDSAERLAMDYYLPIAAALDKAPPAMVDGSVEIMSDVGEALRAYAEGGFPGLSFTHEEGGLQLPYTVGMAANGIFSAANLAIANYSTLTMAAAHLLTAFGTEEQKTRYAAPMIAGEWGGTMCLSEPQAGSSLADITTRAEAADDGTYHLYGTKMWISGAAHSITRNIINLVLARTHGAPAGVKGLSLFIVPQRLVNDDGSLGPENNITLVGLNHKMGQRGTTNCMLNFGETGPTKGYLIGRLHEGLRCMFHMMNEARVSVGHQATTLGTAGYLYSRDYAVERAQGRPIGDKDPLSPQVALVAHADVRRMLLAQKAATEGALALAFFCGSLIDRSNLADAAEREELELLLDLLTPMVKSWPSEHCLEANKLAIQVLGGAGYTQDHPVERLYRDNRLNHIHEGTFGIQGIDLLGRKVRMAQGKALALLRDRIGATVSEATIITELAGMGEQLQSMLGRLDAATAAALACDDAERAHANATLYLDAVGTVVVAWLWLWQAVVASRRLDGGVGSSAFHDAKLTACRYFFRYVLPDASNKFTLVETLDATCADMSLEQVLA